MQASIAAVPILIVTFRNTSDVVQCLRAISKLRGVATPSVFICENGGAAAFGRLLAALTGDGGPCEPDPARPCVPGGRFAKAQRLLLKSSDGSEPIPVHAGCAGENLGYAGGINAWLRPLLECPDWPGAWVLNPDTVPEPDALSELVLYAARHGRGMVGSRLSSEKFPGLVHCRGLAWGRFRGSTISIDRHMPVSTVGTLEAQDARLDAPSGASVYVTRECLTNIGLMDERYFLYFEDLDWGLRARACGGVGYAHRSVVWHTGGTTIGTSTVRREQSRLSVYLDFRNRLLFVRMHFPRWYGWTALAATAHAAMYLRAGAIHNMMAGLQGTFAALRGQSGRPDAILRAHIAETSGDSPETHS